MQKALSRIQVPVLAITESFRRPANHTSPDAGIDSDLPARDRQTAPDYAWSSRVSTTFGDTGIRLP